MSNSRSLFSLRDDITVGQVITGIHQIAMHSRAIQSSMVVLASDKRSAADNFEEICGLSTQVENNLSQIEELAEWLDSQEMKEAQS